MISTPWQPSFLNSKFPIGFCRLVEYIMELILDNRPRAFRLKAARPSWGFISVRPVVTCGRRTVTLARYAILFFSRSVGNKFWNVLLQKWWLVNCLRILEILYWFWCYLCGKVDFFLRQCRRLWRHEHMVTAISTPTGCDVTIAVGYLDSDLPAATSLPPQVGKPVQTAYYQKGGGK